MEISLTNQSREQAGSHTGERIGANGRLRAASLLRLARREVRAALNGPSFYVMITLACLVASIFVKSYLDYVSDNGTLVLAFPLKTPLLFAVVAMTAYLGLAAAAGLAGERERGTLEVLFYGPVDSPTYIGAKLAGHLATYVLAVGGLAGFLGLAALLTGMPLDGDTLLLLAASTLPAAAMIALGLLVAALAGRLWPAVVLTGLVLALYIAIDTGNQFAASQPGDSLLGSAAGLLSGLAAVAGWLSPFGYVWRAADAFALGSVGDALLDLGIALVYCAVLTGLAVVALRTRGVQRWRE